MRLSTKVTDKLINDNSASNGASFEDLCKAFRATVAGRWNEDGTLTVPEEGSGENATLKGYVKVKLGEKRRAQFESFDLRGKANGDKPAIWTPEMVAKAKANYDKRFAYADMPSGGKRSSGERFDGEELDSFLEG
jgi:hypothetical protein